MDRDIFVYVFKAPQEKRKDIVWYGYVLSASGRSRRFMCAVTRCPFDLSEVGVKTGG